MIVLCYTYVGSLLKPNYTGLCMNTREGDSTPLQCSCLENPMDGGAWWAAVHGVVKSGIQLSNFTLTSHFQALEKEMATHSSVLAWRSQGRGSLVGCHLWGCRVGHDWSDFAAAAAAANGLPRLHRGKESSSQYEKRRDIGLICGSGRFPWHRKWQPTPVFLPGKFHWRRSLADHNPWGHKESYDRVTEHSAACMHTHRPVGQTG